jgi:hypothetical protein
VGKPLGRLSFSQQTALMAVRCLTNFVFRDQGRTLCTKTSKYTRDNLGLELVELTQLMVFAQNASPQVFEFKELISGACLDKY